MASAWKKPILASDAIHRFHIKPCHMAKALKAWQGQSVGVLRTQFTITKKVIWRLDQAKENMPLSATERDLRHNLKMTYLSLLSFRKIKLRQCSRLTEIRLWDANTIFFHARINTAGERTSFRRCLLPSEWQSPRRTKRGYYFRTSKSTSARLAQDRRAFYGKTWTFLRMTCLVWMLLFMLMRSRRLFSPFPSIKAPGPDSFIGAFFKSCWEIIKNDVVAAICCLAAL